MNLNLKDDNVFQEEASGGSGEEGSDNEELTALRKKEKQAIKRKEKLEARLTQLGGRADRKSQAGSHLEETA